MTKVTSPIATTGSGGSLVPGGTPAIGGGSAALLGAAVGVAGSPPSPLGAVGGGGGVHQHGGQPQETAQQVGIL